MKPMNMIQTNRGSKGVTMIELVISMATLMLVLSSLASAMYYATLQQRRLHQRDLAQLEAANLLERIASLPWGDTTTEKCSSLSTSDVFRREAPSAKHSIEVFNQTDNPSTPVAEIETKRIRIEIELDATAPTAHHVQLVGWKFRPRKRESRE